MTTLTEFHLFSTLPSELRCKIWTFLLPPARNVPIRFSHHHKQYITTRSAGERSLSPLWTCTASRNIFRLHYIPLRLSASYDSSIFVNLDRDTLFFDHEDCSPRGDLALDLMGSPQRLDIRRVAFDMALWEILRVFRFDALSEVRGLPALQSVALVLQTDKMRDEEGQMDRGRSRVSSALGRIPRPTARRAGPAVGHGNGNGNGSSSMADTDDLQAELRHANWWVQMLKMMIREEDKDAPVMQEGGGIREEGSPWKNGDPSPQLCLW